MSKPSKAEAKRALEKLDNATGKDGHINLTYLDGYYAKSLERKYGMSIAELRKIASGK
jgi:hypothetical protein